MVPSSHNPTARENKKKNRRHQVRRYTDRPAQQATLKEKLEIGSRPMALRWKTSRNEHQNISIVNPPGRYRLGARFAVLGSTPAWRQKRPNP